MTTRVVVLVRPTLFAAIGTSFLRRSLHHNLSLVSTTYHHHHHHRNNNTSFHSYSSSNGGSSSSSSSIIKLRSRRRMRNLCTRATQANDSASSSIHDSSSLIHSMEKKIKEQLNAQVVVVKDAYGDGRHVSIDVVSSAFEGASAVNRQRMVYKAIWEELQTTVHAVDQMTTRTPAEAAVNR